MKKNRLLRLKVSPKRAYNLYKSESKQGHRKTS